MAREVAPPIEAPPLSIETWRQDEEEYIAKLRSAATMANDGEYVGEIVKWQRGDGYAVYMVWSERPLEVMHLAIGDAWTAEPSLIRGLRLADVKQQVEWERAWKRSSTEPNDTFYGSVEPGDIVHYSNGFAQFVRCKVVSDPTGIQGVTLLPIALVGEVGRRQDEQGRWIHGWSEHDVVVRRANGEPHWGYHAKKIIEGETMQPHASSMYEYSESLQTKGPDPRAMEPLSLEPPPLTPEAERSARLVKAVDAIRARLDHLDYSEAGLREALADVAALALNELDRKE